MAIKFYTNHDNPIRQLNEFNQILQSYTNYVKILIWQTQILRSNKIDSMQ